MMKAMTLRLDDTEYERLRTVAFVEKRSVTDVVREAILGYVRSKAERAEFRAALQRAMEENAQLIADLANY
jgi:predicted transcriptional regulator